MTTDAVTLVIPGRNTARTLVPCLDAVVPLVGRDGLREIIFVDDGSTDDTAAVAARYPVRVLSVTAGGPGHARNAGWRAAETPLVWFLDADCVAAPDALALLLPLLDAPDVAGAGGSYDNLLPGSLLAILIHEEIVQRHLAMPKDVNYLATFNVLYRRAALDTVGGFDEGRVNGPGRPGAEDVDLAYRLHAAGFRLRFDRRSRVGHFHPTRLTRYLRSQALHGYFRVLLYLAHAGRMTGDAYSGVVDHAQPPLAMLVLAALPLLFLGWPWRLAPALLAALLLLLQLPMTLRLLARTRSPRMLAYIPMGFVRAFARGLGMSLATLRSLTGRLRSRPPRNHSPEVS